MWFIQPKSSAVNIDRFARAAVKLWRRTCRLLLNQASGFEENESTTFPTSISISACIEKPNESKCANNTNGIHPPHVAAQKQAERLGPALSSKVKHLPLVESICRPHLRENRLQSFKASSSLPFSLRHCNVGSWTWRHRQLISTLKGLKGLMSSTPFQKIPALRLGLFGSKSLQRQLHATCMHVFQHLSNSPVQLCSKRPT